MKHYPSIDFNTESVPITAFIKYDGSNICVEWSKKQGFCKFGTRKNLFDHTSRYFADVIPLFYELWASQLEAAMRHKDLKNFREITFYFEYLGAKTFAGHHQINDPKTLILIDVNPLKKGILHTRAFLDMFGHLDQVAEIAYRGMWNKDFEERVHNNDPILMSNYAIKQPIPEGVICKWGEGHKLRMAKIKTRAWKEELKIRHPNDWQQFL